MGTVKLKLAAFRRSSFSQSTRDELMGAIWKEFYGRLVVFVSLFEIGDRASRLNESEDIVQEIMVKIMINLHRYNPRCAFTTWIYSVARNHCRDWARKQRVRSRAATDFQVEEAPSRWAGPEQSLLLREEEAIAERFLDNLADGERQIAFLRFVEHQRYDDIGRILEIPPGTVRYRIHEIRRGLEDALEKGSL